MIELGHLPRYSYQWHCASNPADNLDLSINPCRIHAMWVLFHIRECGE